VAAVLAALIGLRLEAYGGNLTGLIQFGSQFTSATHPPAGAIVSSPSGYDAQFFYVQALDPLLLKNSTVEALRSAGAGFRMQRMAYPLLAFLLSGGQRAAVPFALLAINVLVLLGLSIWFGLYARRRGWSTWWAAALALMPGMLLPVARDLSDPLATSTMLAGFLLWRDGRRWPAALALTVAILTREVMILAVAAVLVEACVRAWRAADGWSGFRMILGQAWPVVLVPAAAFAGWQLYITARYGGPVGGAGLQFPLLNVIDEARASLRGYKPMAIWDLAYLALILAAAVSAVFSLLRGVTITSVGAAALALGVLIPTFGDAWSDTRLSAPLLALVLVDGLTRQNRTALRIVGAASLMTILIPLAIPGAF
jgi:hypothetical protein